MKRNKNNSIKKSGRFEGEAGPAESCQRGKLFVLSGPSGVGKGTVIEALEEEPLDIEYSVSVTTRAPRPGEKEGEDYYFVDEKEFFRMKENDDFLEWALVHNNYYGTLREKVENILESGKNLILELDIQGAKQIREKFPQAVLIFLLPPSLEELEHRLNKRGSENNESKKIRLHNARKELKQTVNYDYQVENVHLEETVRRVKEIIAGESPFK